MTDRPKSGNRILVAVFIGVIGLFFAYGALWRAGAKEMKRSIETWADDQRSAGIDIHYDRVATKGFPFFLRGVVEGAAIAGGEEWAWRAPLLYVDALPLSPDRLIISAGAPHTVDLGAFGAWRINSADGRASVANDKARLWVLDVESGPGRLERIDGAVSLAADKFLLTVAPAEGGADRLEASLTAANVVAQSGSALIDAPRIEAMIAVDGASAAPEGADLWRAAGGGIDLKHVFIEANGSMIRLSGKLAIDAAGYPAGALNAEIVNPGPVALLLGEAGAISKSDAQAAAAALTLAAIAGGGKLKAPLLFKDGVASIAGVALAKLPRVE